MPAPSITYTALPDIPLVAPGDDVAAIVIDGLKRAQITLADDDIIVIAQKIVSKAENRYVNLADVTPSKEAHRLAAIVGKDPRHVETVLRESSEVVKCRQNVMIVAHRLGFVMANAGIDESNIDHGEDGARVLLLPADPDGACAAIKNRLDREFGVSAGVIINDSFGRAWRNGVVGVALGAAGICSLESMIGAPDLFGRALRITEIAVADELAAGASLLMGQGKEGRPVIHVRGFKSAAPAKPAAALVRPKQLDMFR